MPWRVPLSPAFALEDVDTEAGAVLDGYGAVAGVGPMLWSREGGGVAMRDIRCMPPTSSENTPRSDPDGQEQNGGWLTVAAFGFSHQAT